MTELEMANQLLKSLATTSIRIVDRGGRISLCVSIPKQGQRWIALGLRNDLSNLKKCLIKAFEVDEQVINGSFNLQSIHKVKQRSLAEWIIAFENHYFSVNAKTPQSETTWKGEYLKSFKKIKGDRLTEEALLNAILSTNPDTRTRKRVVQACQLLSNFAGMGWDFSEYKGSYSYKSVNPRHLPSDEKILWWGNRIESDRWQWFYWMVVVYGLRPSENFFCYPLAENILQIEPTKTDEVTREAYPLHWDWPNKLDLMNFKKPAITFRRPEEISQRAGKYFGKRGGIDLPFTFTDLRHCWARRATELGLDPETAARSLGHSLEIHQRIYKAWIGQQVYRRKFLDLVRQS